MGKNLKSIESARKEFEAYFKDDLDAIEEELKKSKEYSEIIDSEIDKLSAPSLGSNKGTQHYLIEHITNAVQLQTQRQGLRKDRFTIKKAIMDYASKFTEENGGKEGEIMDLLNKLIDKDKTSNMNHINTSVNNLQNDVDIDSEIDDILNGEDN